MEDTVFSHSMFIWSFLTKYRRSIFTDEHLMTIRASAEKVCGDFGASLREFNGERNHVHLLVSYPPKVSISSLSTALRRDEPDIKEQVPRT